jgi:hypothetical protein
MLDFVANQLEELVVIQHLWQCTFFFRAFFQPDGR